MFRKICSDLWWWTQKSSSLTVSPLPQRQTGLLGRSPVRNGLVPGADGSRLPPLPPTNLRHERSSAVDVHQMRTGRLSGSAQFLHEIGRNTSPECRQCRNTNCEAEDAHCAAKRVTPPTHPADLRGTDRCATPHPRGRQDPTVT